MKKMMIGLAAMGAILFAACNGGGQQSHEGHDTTAMDMGAAQTAAVPDSAAVKETAPQFANADPKAVASINTVIDRYLELKNGLAADDGNAAAAAGKAMGTALAAVDPSVLTPEQKKVYADNADDLKEHAEHISKNGGNIKHQREHFASMSEDVYALAVAFGGGRTLYHDHCPMYNNNKGALWISETKEIRNPYLGSEMPTCGTVEELIKK